MATWKRIPTVSDNLSAFAATTSEQLRGVLSDESGTGVAIFAGGNIGAGDATTQSASDGSTKIATTAYVDNQAALGDTSLDNTKIWIGTSENAKAEFPLSGDVTMTAGGVVSVVGGNADTVTTNANLTGDITSSGNATVIAAGVIINADVKSDAAIAISKTALVAGTGMTLSTNTLNVDAAQTQITSVGTIGTGEWAATDVAIAHGGTGASTAAAAATALGVGTGDAPTFAGLTVTGEFVASSGTVKLTGQVEINDEIVILNSDASGTVNADVNVGFEVERGSNSNAKLLWREKGGTNALSRWEVTMQGSTGDGYVVPLAVMGTDDLKSDVARSIGDGAFYQNGGALYVNL